MNKQEFLSQLRKRLSALPQKEVNERLNFYSELIDDKIEEGLSEETAVEQIGTIDEIVTQIETELSPLPIKKKTSHKKENSTLWKSCFLTFSAPIGFALLIALMAIIFSFYVVLWVIPIVLWTVFVAFCVCAIVLSILSVLYISVGYIPLAITLLGTACILLGLSIFLYFGCKSATKGVESLTKKSIHSIF